MSGPPGTDVAAGMIEVSRALNPDSEHHVGDMHDLRLGRTFDAIFIHDAIELHGDRGRPARRPS